MSNIHLLTSDKYFFGFFPELLKETLFVVRLDKSESDKYDSFLVKETFCLIFPLLCLFF